MTYRIIGLTGAIGAGKDSVANILTDQFDFTQMAFKDKMVDALCHIFELDRKFFTDRALKAVPNPALYGQTPRNVMRSFGTDWARNMVTQNIWVDELEKKILSSANQHIVISDVRFPNEVSLIRRYGGQIWKVERPDNPYAGQMSSHASDTPIESEACDKILVNDGTFQDLAAKIRFFMAVYPEPLAVGYDA